jgi:hypothetical protein
VSIEPGLADLVDVGPDVVTDWDAYRTCPICRAAIGERCFAMFAAVVDGQTAGPRKRLTVPHGSRRRRRGR